MIAFLVLTACVEDVAKDKVEAKVEAPPVEEPAAVAAKEAPAKPSGTPYAVDKGASTLKALGAKITATHPIVFHDYAGEVFVDAGKVTGVSFTVQMASLEADHPKLTAHLKDPDFFDVPNHPTATFQSVSVSEGTDEAGMTHTVTGDFTIRGETKRVTFPALVEVKDDTVHAATEFALNRQDFKVTYPGRPDDLVQDKVLLTIDFHAPKPQG